MFLLSFLNCVITNPGSFTGSSDVNDASSTRKQRATRPVFLKGMFILYLIIFPLLTYGQIHRVTQLTARPGLYERLDFEIVLAAHWTNSPYRSEEVRVDLDLTSPSGAAVDVPAFYEKGQSGGLSFWKVRFAPMEAGKYRGHIVLLNGDNIENSAPVLFSVSPSHQKGFLHPGNDWTFHFDDGEPFRGIGENVGWESRSRDDSRFFQSLNENAKYNYQYLLGSLSADGGNFFRTWMCPWNLPLEWKIVGNARRYTNSDDYFNASAIQRMDQLVDLTESLDLYMMLTLDNSGDFQGGSWRRNSYNSANGGPAAAPQEFFTDLAARAQYKDRLRYIVARWGYSPHIGAFEFFNEIDNLMYGLPEKIPDKVITTWHREMADYLKSIDPYHHLITTSISHREVEGLYGIPSIDFNQIHIYGHDGQSRMGLFPDTLRRNSQRYGKPFVIGEYGFEWDWNKNFDDDPVDMDWDFKRGLWLGLFSPTPVLPMSWWWEYFDHRGTTKYIGRVRSILDEMLAAGNGAFESVKCKWIGPPIQTLSVRCGDAIFVLLENDQAVRLKGDVFLPVDSVNFDSVQLYDPESGTTNVPPDLELSGSTVKDVAVPPRDCVVLIARMSLHRSRSADLLR